jgi:hypothetical protein
MAPSLYSTRRFVQTKNPVKPQSFEGGKKMIGSSVFHHRPSAIVRAIALFALLLVIAWAATIAVTSRSAARTRRLSFEDRVAA